MIITHELKSQIEQLTRQHDDVLAELTRMKQKLNSIEENTEQKQFPLPTPILVQIPQPQLDAQSQVSKSGGAGTQQSTSTELSSLPEGSNAVMKNPSSNLNSQAQDVNMLSNPSTSQQNPMNTNPKQPLIDPTRIAQVKELANELLKIKETIGNLEQKTRQFVNDQSKNQFAEKDVVHLVMIVVQAMTDWASEYLQTTSSQQK